MTTSTHRRTRIAGLTAWILAKEALLMFSGWNSEVADRATNNAIVDHAMVRTPNGAITVLITHDPADPKLGHGKQQGIKEQARRFSLNPAAPLFLCLC